jgi:hypothetical protein
MGIRKSTQTIFLDSYIQTSSFVKSRDFSWLNKSYGSGRDLVVEMTDAALNALSLVEGKKEFEDTYQLMETLTSCEI